MKTGQKPTKGLAQVQSGRFRAALILATAILAMSGAMLEAHADSVSQSKPQVAIHTSTPLGDALTEASQKPTVPDWSFPIGGRSRYFKQGLSPTLMGAFSYEGRNLTGNYFFSAPNNEIRRLGEAKPNSALLWTDQNTMGELSLVNPGLDVIALDFVIDF